jgi:hypothetical protein
MFHYIYLVSKKDKRIFSEIKKNKKSKKNEILLESKMSSKQIIKGC